MRRSQLYGYSLPGQHRCPREGLHEIPPCPLCNPGVDRVHIRFAICLQIQGPPTRVSEMRQFHILWEKMARVIFSQLITTSVQGSWRHTNLVQSVIIQLRRAHFHLELHFKERWLRCALFAVASPVSRNTCGFKLHLRS